MGHHAYLIEGDVAQLSALAVLVSKELQVEAQGNPDFHVRTYAAFGIDDARALKNLAQLRSASGIKVFIFCANQMTTEAQNALLKLFEEPPTEARFYLLVPHGIVLPTLRSRCAPYEFLQSPADEMSTAREFLEGSYADRTKLIGSLLKDKDREAVRRLIDGIEQMLFSAQDRSRYHESLADIALVRRYLADRSPSLKMLLEHLAASIPKISS